MPDLGPVAHVLAAFATANFAATIFSGRARNLVALAVAAGLVIVTRLLGAEWVVHPAAGMLLAFLIGWMDGGSRRWQQHLPVLGVALLSAAAFMALGAGWLVFPLAIVLGITLLSYLTNIGQTASAPQPAIPAELPQQAGGGAMPSAQPSEQLREQVAVPRASESAAAQVKAEGAQRQDSLAALHHDTRLPPEARALLLALDLRTAEAIRALAAQGQTGTEAAYQARAIREEYAPAAVQGYLKLPPTRADSTPLDGGKTGRELLCEQLDLLLNATQRLLDASARAGGQDLLSNGRFLREKFGDGEGDLKL